MRPVFINEYLLVMKGIKSIKMPRLNDLLEYRPVYNNYSESLDLDSQANKDEDYFALGLSHLFEPLLVLLFGYGCSIFVFIIEICLQCFCKKIAYSDFKSAIIQIIVHFIH